MIVVKDYQTSTHCDLNAIVKISKKKERKNAKQKL